jgi:hypothetical protein
MNSNNNDRASKKRVEKIRVLETGLIEKVHDGANTEEQRQSENEQLPEQTHTNDNCDRVRKRACGKCFDGKAET